MYFPKLKLVHCSSESSHHSQVHIGIALVLKAFDQFEVSHYNPLLQHHVFYPS
jgi:hypothetical protein